MNTPSRTSELVLVGKIFASAPAAAELRQGGNPVNHALKVVWSPEEAHKLESGWRTENQKESKEQLAQTMTLADCYRRYLMPEHQQRASRDTLLNTLRALDLWEDYHAGRPPRERLRSGPGKRRGLGSGDGDLSTEGSHEHALVPRAKPPQAPHPSPLPQGERESSAMEIQARTDESACQDGQANHRRTGLNHRSATPVVAELEGEAGDEQLRGWVDWLARSGPWSPSRIDRLGGAVMAILNRLGPRSKGNPKGQGLIVQLPAFPSLEETSAQFCGRSARASASPCLEDAPPRVIEAWELDAVYQACSAASWPAACTQCRLRTEDWAPLVWRTALVLWYVTGLRTQDVFAYEPGPTLTWKQIDFASPCPFYRRLESVHGWLWSVPRKTRRHKKRLILPLHETVRLHLVKIRAALESADDRPVLPCQHSNNRFYGQWNALQAAAAGSASRRWEPFRISDLRKTASNAWDFTHDGLGLGAKVLLHDTSGVNAEYYANLLPRLVAAISSLPVPSSFLAGQRCLF